MFEPPDRDALVLAIGDLLAVAAVVGSGIVDHHGLAGLADPVEVAGTVGPFVVGFAVAALLVGCYGSPNTGTAAAQLRSVAAAATGAVGIGLVLRTSPAVEGGAAWPFGLVMLGTITVGLLAWRTVAIVVARYRSGAADATGGEPAGE